MTTVSSFTINQDGSLKSISPAFEALRVINIQCN